MYKEINFIPSTFQKNAISLCKVGQLKVLVSKCHTPAKVNTSKHDSCQYMQNLIIYLIDNTNRHHPVM